MVVSRRSFMKQGTLLILTAGASLGNAKRIIGRESLSEKSNLEQGLSVSPSKSLVSLKFTKATFAPYLDTVFRIYPDASRSIKSTLIRIADIGPVPDQKVPDRECFVLRFRGSQPLPQRSYRIEHNSLGRFELLLVPAGKNKKGWYYQATINRLNA
jgi:hypothetical protein